MLHFPSNLWISVDGIRLHVRAWGGGGQWMVWLTGLGSSASTFDEIAHDFVNRFRVVGVTRRGMEPSDRPVSGYDLATLTSDLTGLLDALDIEQAHFVGHSLGGLEMTELAIHKPERALSLVYLDAGIDPSAANELQERDPVGAVAPGSASVATQIDEWWCHHKPAYARLSGPVLSLYAVSPERPDPPRNADRHHLEGVEEYWRGTVRPWVRMQAAEFRRLVPHAKVVVLEPASHYLYVDRKSEVVKEMQAFYDAFWPRRGRKEVSLDGRDDR